MKKTSLIATILLLPLAFTACNKTAEESKADEPVEQMGSMTKPSETKIAKGSGTVSAIDKVAGKITIDHGPIAELQWPAMKMGFDSRPELLSTVAVGDRVEFDLTVIGTASEVTAIKKR